MLDTSTEGGLGMPHEWYEIRVEGHLPSGWTYWFEGLDLQCGPGRDSILSGYLPDQAALHGVLAKIRDLNLKLISVNRRTI
jgi:hypothetical protein